MCGVQLGSMGDDWIKRLEKLDLSHTEKGGDCKSDPLFVARGIRKHPESL